MGKLGFWICVIIGSSLIEGTKYYFGVDYSLEKIWQASFWTGFALLMIHFKQVQP